MSENKASIALTWDSSGRIKHKISGFTLPSPRDNLDLWVLAPSAIFLAIHQLGTLRPSHGLLLCSQLLDIMVTKKFILSPINSTLKSGRIELIYKDDGSMVIQFHPNHPILHNNDSLEEGVRQFVSNYFYYVFNHFSEYYQIVIKTLSCVAIGSYLEFLNNIFGAGLIGPNSDRWNIEFSRASSLIVQRLSLSYYVPESENDEWAEWAASQTKTINDKLPELFNQHNELCKKMGIL